MTLLFLYILINKKFKMKKKKNITIRIEPKLYELIDENFDNKSKLIEWFIIEGLSKNDKYKEEVKKIIFNNAK